MVNFKSLLLSAAVLSTLVQATPMPTYDMMRECEDCKDLTQGGQGEIGNTGTPPAAPAPPAPPVNGDNTVPTGNNAAPNGDNTVPKGPYDNQGANPNFSGNTPGSDTPFNPPTDGAANDVPCEDHASGENTGTALGEGLTPAPTHPKDNPPAPTSTPPLPTSTPPLTAPLASTTTSPATAAETTPPTTPLPPPQPVCVKGDVPLWNQRPTRSDMAPILGQSESWKELAAVADAIINVSPGWIPSTVFQAPDEYYDGLVLMAEPTDLHKPSIRVEKDNSTRVHVNLTLFALAAPLHINVTFDLQKDASNVAWPQALQAAWAHEDVQARLQNTNPKYAGPFVDNDESGNKFKTMALLEMLTGSPAQLAEGVGRVDPPADMSVKIEDTDSLWSSWLENPFSGTPLVDSLTTTPTIVFNNEMKLQPITRKVGTDKEFILHNCKKAGAEYAGDNYDDKDAVDMAWTLDDLYEVFLWSARLVLPDNKQDSQSALLEVQKDRLQNPEYYQSP